MRNIREKVVTSDLFSVGGYFFTTPAEFLQHNAALRDKPSGWQRELYISDVIGSMILAGIPFRARRISDYQDWGTIHEWKKSLGSCGLFFVVLDGSVFERGSAYFKPTFVDVPPNAAFVAVLQERAAQGHTIIYLSVRPNDLRELTEAQMRETGVPPGMVTYDCPSAPWSLVTAPDPRLHFRTSTALELSPSDPNIKEKLQRLETRGRQTNRAEVKP